MCTFLVYFQLNVNVTWRIIIILGGIRERCELRFAGGNARTNKLWRKLSACGNRRKFTNAKCPCGSGYQSYQLRIIWRFVCVQTQFTGDTNHCQYAKFFCYNWKIGKIGTNLNIRVHFLIYVFVITFLSAIK